MDAPNLVADVIPIDGAAELEIAVLRMHSKLVVLTEGNERLKTIGVVAVALVTMTPPSSAPPAARLTAVSFGRGETTNVTTP
ncbi:MAG TPA: hypothetical protein VK988_11455 [Acidimicrobiales bacterium]|nr:hypothetical protein [Acidimicrobiales bacterium]